MESLRRLILRHQWFLIFLSVFLFSLVLEEFNNFFIIFVLIYSLIIPGYVILRHFKFNSHLDAIEKVGMSFFFSLFFLTIIGSISWIYIFNKWILALFLIIIPALIEFIFNKEKNSLSLKSMKKLSNNLKINTIILLLVASLISVFIHAIPSILNDYPLGFDTYQLHIIRINYILNDGKEILGDIVTKDFLNPFRYQWGYHMFVGTLGVLIEQDSIFLLRILPLINSSILPISIYIACPFFGLKTKKGRILASLISPLFFHNPVILGLIYPLPSSVGLILFIFSFRILFEIYNNDKKLIILYFILVLVSFYFYKGLGIILFLIFLVFLPILIFKSNFNEPARNNSRKVLIATFLFCIIISFISTIFLNFIFQVVGEQFNFLSLFSFDFNIFNLYQIEGFFSITLFIISIFWLVSHLIFKFDKFNYILLLQFLLLLILSSGYFMGVRWLLYLTPIIIFFNIKFIIRLFEIIESKLEKVPKFKGRKAHLKITLSVLLISGLSIEPILYNLFPAHSLNPEFGEVEEIIYSQSQDLENNSVVLSTYKMYKFYSCYSIEKNKLHISKNYYINYYYLDRTAYPLFNRYGVSEKGGSVQILNHNNLSKILDLNDNSSDNRVYFYENIGRRPYGEISFGFNKDTLEEGKIVLYSYFGQEIVLLIHNKSTTIQYETANGWEEIPNISLNDWYNITIKFNRSRNPQYEFYLNSNLTFTNNYSIGANKLVGIEFSTSYNDSNYHFYIDPPSYSWSNNYTRYWHELYGNNRSIYFNYVRSDFIYEFEYINLFTELIPDFSIIKEEKDFVILKI